MSEVHLNDFRSVVLGARTLRTGLLALLRTEQEATSSKGHRYERSKDATSNPRRHK